MSELGVGRITWVDLTVPAASELREFYAAVVGWSTSEVAMGDYADFGMHPAAEGVGVIRDVTGRRSRERLAARIGHDPRKVGYRIYGGQLLIVRHNGAPAVVRSHRRQPVVHANAPALEGHQRLHFVLPAGWSMMVQVEINQ
jgi:hypothetical protein